jgi:oligopeptide transport system permease protein
MAVESAVAVEAVRFRRREASLWRDAFARLAKNRAALAGGVVIIGLIFIAITATWIAPYPYDLTDISAGTINQGISGAHWMGTDALGRDLLSRMFVGGRISMSVGIVTQLIIVLIGVPIGAAAGYFGGRLDNALMRVTDVIYSFPDLLFVIILMTAFRDTPFAELMNGLFLIFLAIGIVNWPTMARIVRGQFLQLREKEFIEAAHAMGVSDFQIVVKHLLPNCIGPMTVAITLGIPQAIMTEATLSFIGIGVRPPMCSWGSLVQQGFQFVTAGPHQVVFPALAIAITMLAFTFLGDGLRDALDPYMKK